MSGGKVRYAVIGTGGIAETHAAALRQVERAELFMVYDRDTAKAEDFARRHGCRAARSPEEIAESGADAVSIATPSGTHAAVAVPMAKAGKHVFCEKPLDVTSEKAEQIIQACREKHVLLTAVLPLRFCDTVRWTKHCADLGCLGSPVLTSASMRWFRAPEYYADSWRGSRSMDGGVLMNQGIHFADLLLYFNGAAAEVSAFSVRRMHLQLEVDDTVCASIRFRNGSLGLFEVSTACAPGNPKRFEFSGTEGSIVMEDDRIVRTRFREEPLRAGTPPEGSGSAQDSASPLLSDCELHRRQFANFTAAILDGVPLEVPGGEGLAAIRLIEAITRSAASGERVFL